MQESILDEINGATFVRCIADYLFVVKDEPVIDVYERTSNGTLLRTEEIYFEEGPSRQDLSFNFLDQVVNQFVHNGGWL